MSRGITSRLGVAGAATALSGALLFGAAGIAQAAPANAPATPAASTQAVVPAAATDTEPTFRHGCRRVWHRAGWSWERGHKRWHRGYWACEWRHR